MQTTLDLYLDFTPCDLYRLGNATSGRFNGIRTSPPRAIGEKVDIDSYIKADGSQWVDAKSGGLSLFNQRLPRMGKHWYLLPARTPIPIGIVISQDAGFRGPGDVIHFTVRPSRDIPLEHFIRLLCGFVPFTRPAFFSVSTTLKT